VAVDKFSVSLPADLVHELDGLADKRGLTRSGVIREAAAEYVAERKSADAEQARRCRIDEAIAAFDRIASSSPVGGRPSLEVLREIRDESMGGPRSYPDDGE
jgi:metal-responsive CopG/Arc/MetJ family transcriptional regulator